MLAKKIMCFQIWHFQAATDLNEKLNFRNITGAAIWTHHKQSYYNYYHETLMGPAFPTNLPQENCSSFPPSEFLEIITYPQLYDQFYGTLHHRPTL